MSDVLAGWTGLSDGLAAGLLVSFSLLGRDGAVAARALPVECACRLVRPACVSCGGCERDGDATCVHGFATSTADVTLDGEVLAHVVMGGFAPSVSERGSLGPRLRAAGVPDAVADHAVRQIPVYSAERARAIVTAMAGEVAARVAAARAVADGEERARQLELIAEAGADLAENLSGSSELPAVVLSRAVELTGADAGRLLVLRSGSDILDVAAHFGPVSSAPERLNTGVAKRAAERGGPVFGDGDDESDVLSLAVPLYAGGSLLGLLTLRRSEGPAFTVQNLGDGERFGLFTGNALTNAKWLEAVQRDLLELTHLEEVSLALHSGLSVAELAPQTVSILEKAVEFTVGGVVLSGFGHDTGAVAVRGDLNSGDLTTVVAEALGIDEGECDLSNFTVVSYQGSVNDGDATHDDWCVMEAELMVRDVVIGYLFAAAPGQGAFDHADARILRRIAAHAALAFDRAVLLERVRTDFAKTIAALSAAMDAGERMERGHTDRVMELAMSLGEELGLGAEETEILRFAGLLHDVGKVGLSEEILVKPSKLDEDEWARVRKHSEIGAGIVSEIRFLNAIAPVILHHHERWDGKGYPMGLRGNDCPLLARILGVADAYDAMTSETPYRAALSPRQARAEMERTSGTQFDPAIVTALFELLDRRAEAGATGLLGAITQPGPRLPA